MFSRFFPNNFGSNKATHSKIQNLATFFLNLMPNKVKVTKLTFLDSSCQDLSNDIVKERLVPRLLEKA